MVPSSSPPFTAQSPAPRRLPLPTLSTSASDGALLNSARSPPSSPPLPAQPKRIRPFILRSTSPSNRTPPAVQPPKPFTVTMSAASPTTAGPSEPRSKISLPRPTSAPFLTIPVPPARNKKPRKKRTIPGAVAVVEAARRTNAPIQGKPVLRTLGKPTPWELEQQKQQDKRGSLGDMTNSKLRGPNTPPRAVRKDTMQTPNRQSSASPDGKRGRQYGGIGKGTSGAPMTIDSSYSSLQEMLESSGFAETRVITPTTIRSASQHPSDESHSPTRDAMRHSRSLTFNRFAPALTTSALATLKPKPSILTLSGLISRWSSKPIVVEADATSEGGRSDGTIRSGTGSVERNTRAKEWAERVARESDCDVAREYSISPPVTRPAEAAMRGRPRLPRAISVEVELPVPALIDDDEDDDKTPTAASFAASNPPTPPSLSASMITHYAVPEGGVSYTGIDDDLLDHDHDLPRSPTPNPTKPSKWTRSLRHVVSDPSLSFSFGESKEYFSFADMDGIGCEQDDSREYDSDDSAPSREAAKPAAASWGASLRNWGSLAAIGSVWKGGATEPPPPVPAMPKGLVVEPGPALLKKGSRVFKPASAAAPVLTYVGAADFDWSKVPA
ncbi:hypothetical protein P7C70_g6031, partial [Phenoliferia sp. Uapishka_3]